jgi:polyisoprenoid-binding protein YceI
MQTTESIVKTRWVFDCSRTEIAFEVRHLMIAHVKGIFKKFDATIYTTGKDFATADIDVWINTASLTTGDAKRDELLKGSYFFDAATYKQIIFTATNIEKAGSEGMYDLRGDLTIKGIRKNIKLRLQFGGILNDPAGNELAGFSITGKINRRDWGLVCNSAMQPYALMIGDEIKISCEIELINTVSNDSVMDLETAAEREDVI